MKEYHDLTYVGTLGKRVHDLKVNKKITQGIAENAMKLLRTMSHGLCDPAPEWSDTKSTTMTTERTRTFFGRMPRETRAKRQVAVAAVLGSLGGLILSEAMTKLFGGNGGGSEDFKKYMKGVDVKLNLIRKDVIKINQRVMDLQKLVDASSLLSELDLLATLELETWRQLTEHSTRGDQAMMSIMRETVRQWSRLNLLEQGLLSSGFPIPPETYAVQVKGRESRRCAEAGMEVTIVSTVPTTTCYKLLNETVGYTVIENQQQGCFIGSPKGSWIQLRDGTYLMMSRPWESKTTACTSSLLEGFNFHHENQTVFASHEQDLQGTSICGVDNKILTNKRIDKKTAVTIAIPCKGTLVSRENVSLHFYHAQIKVTNQKLDIFGNVDYTDYEGFIEKTIGDGKGDANDNYDLESADLDRWEDTQDTQTMDLMILAWVLASCTIVTGLFIGGFAWWKWNRGWNGDCHEDHYWAGIGMGMDEMDALDRSEKIIRRLEDVSEGMTQLASEMSEHLTEDTDQDEEQEQNQEHETGNTN